MKLFYSPTSPYARKARAVLREKNLAAEVEEVLANPWAQDDSVSELCKVNPLGKVPALLGRNGEAVFDSRVICAYFDAAGSGPKLIPAAFGAGISVLRAEAVADGIMDAAVAIVLDGRKPEEQQSPAMQVRWREAISRGVAFMAAASREFPGEIDLGAISFAVALGYLDLRLSGMDWRAQQPGLAQWYAEAALRPSLAATAPPAS